jgi:uncharacterized integral membrane protein (TIGR00698 family)
MWAFIYSILVANVVRLPAAFRSGIDFAAGTLLRGGIALLGITVSALVWVKLGYSLIAPLFVVFFFFFFALWLGKRFKLTRTESALVGIGTAICGASAIAATGPAIEASEEEIALALSAVTLYGLLIMFAYPFLYLRTVVGSWLGHNDLAYAVWAGSTLYETAQIAAAGEQVSNVALDGALLVKSIRIFMIGPMATIAALLFRKRKSEKARHVSIPTFAVMFVVASLLGTLLDFLASARFSLPLLNEWSSTKLVLSNYLIPFLLSVAFAGVGFKVNIASLLRAGRRTFLLGAITATVTTIIGLMLAILLMT